MIICRLLGGTGNQLHIFSAGLSLAGRLQSNLVIDISNISSKYNSKRKLELHQIFKNIKSYPKISLISFENSTNNEILDLMKNIYELKFEIWKDSKELVSKQIPKIKPCTMVDGHFLDFNWADIAIEYGFPRNLDFVEPQIIPEFKDFLNGQIHLHIRLGDYLKNRGFFPEIPENYYLKSLERFSSFNKKIYIFTDDIINFHLKYRNLAKIADQIFSKKNYSPLITLKFLSKGSVIISANSTFSTWASWFSTADIIATPVPHTLESNWQDYLPAHWERFDLNKKKWL